MASEWQFDCHHEIRLMDHVPHHEEFKRMMRSNLSHAIMLSLLIQSMPWDDLIKSNNPIMCWHQMFIRSNNQMRSKSLALTRLTAWNVIKCLAQTMRSYDPKFKQCDHQSSYDSNDTMSESTMWIIECDRSASSNAIIMMLSNAIVILQIIWSCDSRDAVCQTIAIRWCDQIKMSTDLGWIGSGFKQHSFKSIQFKLKWQRQRENRTKQFHLKLKRQTQSEHNDNHMTSLRMLLAKFMWRSPVHNSSTTKLAW